MQNLIHDISNIKNLLPFKKVKFNRAIKLVFTISIIAFPILLWGTSNLARQNYLETLEINSYHALELHAANLRGELEKFQAIPKLLGTNEDVVAALRFPRDVKRIQAVNQLLVRMNGITGAADTYLMDVDGDTIAASNWDLKTSFIGKNFNFRPYFIDAAQGRLGRYFALGTTTLVRGYYFASPVFFESKIIGISVVKVNLEAIEIQWKTPSSQSIAVSDNDGIFFLTNRPEWRYRTLTALSDEGKNKIRTGRKYLDITLQPTNLDILDEFSADAKIIKIDTLDGTDPDANFLPQKFLMQSLQMPEAGWTLHIFEDYKIINDQILIAMIVVSLGLASFILATITILQRVNTERQRLMFEARAKQTLEKSAVELERRVIERTSDLRNANVKLEEQINVRRQAEEHLRISQASLLQAEKLAALGKMSAGISHELNQPLSAIRSYADNARKFLERANTDKVQDNLVIISELTQRMGNIIGHLKMFSRKPAVQINAISLNKVIDESVRVVVPRIEDMAVKLEVNWAEENIKVLGSTDRLSQVFINLFGNALDAMNMSENEELTDRVVNRISLLITPQKETVEIRVHDTGHGIKTNDIAQLFDPFFSTKEIGDGLGLGLSISYSIIQDCGGSLQAFNHKDGGAEFIVTLRRAIEEV